MLGGSRGSSLIIQAVHMQLKRSFNKITKDENHKLRKHNILLQEQYAISQKTTCERIRNSIKVSLRPRTIGMMDNANFSNSYSTDDNILTLMSIDLYDMSATKLTHFVKGSNYNVFLSTLDNAVLLQNLTTARLLHHLYS